MSKRGTSIIIISVICIIACFTLDYWDSQQAYYGNSIRSRYVLPFNLQIISGWSHEKGCDLYGFGDFGQVYDGIANIFVHTNINEPTSSYLRMLTILSYGYKKDEVIVQWLSQDSTEYYIRLNSARWYSINPHQIITEEQFTKNDYTWIDLINTK